MVTFGGGVGPGLDHRHSPDATSHATRSLRRDSPRRSARAIPSTRSIAGSPPASTTGVARQAPAAPTPAAATSAPAAPAREPVPLPPAATWRTGLTPAEEARCAALLDDEHADVVLVRVEAEPEVQTLNQLMGKAPTNRRFLKLVVLDGSERLSLRRQQRTDAFYLPTEEDRDARVGETFFAVLQNADPVAKLVDPPPRSIGLAFAGPPPEGRVAASTTQAAAASEQQTKKPAQQSRFERLFGPALRQLRRR